MTDQVSTLTSEPAVFQLGLPPGNGSASCTDCCVAMIIRHQTGKAVTSEQVRQASGHTGGDYTGLTPGQALTALAAFGVRDYVYKSNVTASDVMSATDAGLVLTGVGYWAYPSVAQCEIGGKNDFGFGGPHAILIAGRRYWATKPSFWNKGTFLAGWRFWARDPDHSQGWSAAYDRARTSWLVRAMGGLIGSGSPPWQNTFMIARGVTLRASQEEEPGYDLPMDDHGGGTPDAPGSIPEALPTGKLGLLPPKGAPSLKLASILTGVMPTHPAAADNLSLVPAWILGQNDQFGDCGPVSIANMVLQVTTYLGDEPVHVTQADIFDLYRRSGNPGFDPKTDADDNGVDYQTMLEALLADGIGGKKPIAFAQIDPSNLEELRAAVAIFGGIGMGVVLEEAQKAQTPDGTWDYSPSAAWGGHAVFGGQYTTQPPAPDQLGLISWATEIETSDSFLRNQLGQAWVVIWPEHLGTKQFQEGVSIVALQAAFKQLTGRSLVIPPGVPSPTPAPTPSPAKPLGCLAIAGVLASGVLVIFGRH